MNKEQLRYVADVFADSGLLEDGDTVPQGKRIFVETVETAFVLEEGDSIQFMSMLNLIVMEIAVETKRWFRRPFMATESITLVADRVESITLTDAP